MEARFLYLSASELSKFYESRWREENATELQRKFKFNEVKWNDESPRTFLSSNRGLVVLGLMHSRSSRDAKFRFFCVGVLFCCPQNRDRVIELSSTYLCRRREDLFGGASETRKAEYRTKNDSIRLINHNCINTAIIGAGANARKLFFFRVM